MKICCVFVDTVPCRSPRDSYTPVRSAMKTYFYVFFSNLDY